MLLAFKYDLPSGELALLCVNFSADVRGEELSLMGRGRGVVVGAVGSFDCAEDDNGAWVVLLQAQAGSFGFAQGRLSTTPSLALRAPVGMTKGVG